MKKIILVCLNTTDSWFVVDKEYKAEIGIPDLPYVDILEDEYGFYTNFDDQWGATIGEDGLVRIDSLGDSFIFKVKDE